MEYNSSEELQRHRASDAFTQTIAKKAEAANTEKDKVKAVLDLYIKAHSSTKDVRKMAKLNNRTADQQLDLSAEVVEILEKIKSDLR